ncbi:MAG: PhnD/SsuA/transferrin family substrate-binding protein [Thiohalospira sp.]
MRRAWLLLPLLLLAGCQGEEGDEASPDTEVGEPPLTFVVLPYTSPSRIAERFQPLADYLAEGLGRPVRVHVSRGYAEPLRMLAEGRADLAYLGATGLIRLQRRYPDREDLRPLAAETGYRTAVVVRRDSPYRTLGDLAGETFAFGAYRSLSSHYAPRRLLAEAGIALGDLADYEFLHRQGRVARSVIHGDYNAGAVNADLAGRFTGEGGDLRVLAESGALPPPMVVAGPALEGEMADEVADLLREPLAGGRVPDYVPHFRAPDPALMEVGREHLRAVERPCPGEGRP